MRAAPHPSQDARLAALRRYDVLDTPREEAFDEIVRLLATLCEVPIAVVNLIDEHRQWFKAEVGLGVRETPIETSICSHVILEHDFVEIPDTRLDDRMADNPLCLADEGPLRFYAGALLKTKEGLPIGTLCVLDNVPRTLTDTQRQTIKVLSRQVMRQLDLRLALKRQAVLAREVDHRVKNSLATVAALLSVQARSVGSEEARAALDDARARVVAISELHRQMHETGGEGEVDLGAFLGAVGRQLSASLPPEVSLTVSLPSVRMPSDHAAAAAMIVNEFVANSVKHAFPDGRAGTIEVRGTLTEEGGVIIEARDDGVGASASAAPTTGLGRQIMDASAQKLRAPMDLALTEAGARLSLALPPGEG